jgi:hypothetical protein
VVDVFVGYLRRKLEAAGEPRMLHTGTRWPPVPRAAAPGSWSTCGACPTTAPPALPVAPPGCDNRRPPGPTGRWRWPARGSRPGPVRSAPPAAAAARRPRCRAGCRRRGGPPATSDPGSGPSSTSASASWSPPRTVMPTTTRATSVTAMLRAAATSAVRRRTLRAASTSCRGAGAFWRVVLPMSSPHSQARVASTSWRTARRVRRGDRVVTPASVWAGAPSRDGAAIGGAMAASSWGVVRRRGNGVCSTHGRVRSCGSDEDGRRSP